jgi:hypothetical protein
MNRDVLTLLHSILLVGGFLTLCLVCLPIQTSSLPVLSSPSLSTGFGHGIPQLRSAGGTR